MSQPVSPAPSRPHVPDYGIPDSAEGMLPWSHVTARMEQARNYWVVTATPDGQPHAVPVWGVWVDGALYFGGGNVRWARNLAANPKMAVHLEDGNDVVTMEGTAELFTDATDPVIPKLDAAYQAKYQMGFGAPCWRLRPRAVYAWTSFPADATRWTFAE